MHSLEGLHDKFGVIINLTLPGLWTVCKLPGDLVDYHTPPQICNTRSASAATTPILAGKVEDFQKLCLHALSVY